MMNHDLQASDFLAFVALGFSITCLLLVIP